MTDFLRDPIWQFIGAVLGLIAIAISLAVFFIQRRRKSLVYEVVTSAPLLTLDDQIKGKVKILFENVPVQDVHLVMLYIMNEGNIAITSSDYEYPLTFQFGENAQILSTEIVRTTPDTLRPSYSTSRSEIEFHPMLLNSNDSILLKLLLAQYDGTIRVNARIMGVTEVKRVTITADRLEKIAVWASLLGLILMVSAIFAGPTAFLIGFLIVWISITVNDKAKEKRKRVNMLPISKEAK